MRPDAEHIASRGALHDPAVNADPVMLKAQRINSPPAPVIVSGRDHQVGLFDGALDGIARSGDVGLTRLDDGLGILVEEAVAYRLCLVPAEVSVATDVSRD